MLGTSYRGIASRIIFSLQVCWAESIQKTTNMLGSTLFCFKGSVTRQSGFVLTHRSWKARINKPYPILHNPYVWSKSRPLSRLNQPQENLLVAPTCMNSIVGKYSPFRTRTHKVFDSSIILDSIFASIAILKEQSSRNPIPPCVIGLRHEIPFFSMYIFGPIADPHQNLTIVTLMSTHQVIGSLNTLMA